MPQPETVAGWAEQTPDGFMMSLKAHRIISAWLRNPDKAEPQGFARHVALAQPLIDAGKFAAFLVQFPGKLSAALDIERSLAVLREGFAELPLAVELPTAPDAELDARVSKALRTHNIAQVRHDSVASNGAAMPIDSGDVIYFRFRGPKAAPGSGDGHHRYTDVQIRERAKNVEQASLAGRTAMIVFYGKKDIDTADAALRLTAELNRQGVAVG